MYSEVFQKAIDKHNFASTLEKKISFFIDASQIHNISSSTYLVDATRTIIVDRPFSVARCCQHVPLSSTSTTVGVGSYACGCSSVRCFRPHFVSKIGHYFARSKENGSRKLIPLFYLVLGLSHIKFPWLAWAMDQHRSLPDS